MAFANGSADGTGSDARRSRVQQTASLPVIEGPKARKTKGDNDRRLTIIEVARDVFIKDGFAASSMSSIARHLGGSKGTLYAYFSSKDELFAEVVTVECDRKITVMFETGWTSGENIRNTLRSFGQSFVRLIFSEDTMRFTRMIIAESDRRPELGALFYEAGPRKSRLRLAKYLDDQVVAGRLPPFQTQQAAKQFCDLCLNELYIKRLMNIVPPPHEDEIDAIVDAALSDVSASFDLHANAG